MARGIERKRIFKNKLDKEDFLKRLAELCDAESLAVYAWVLMPNHFHLLVRTGNRPLASVQIAKGEGKKALLSDSGREAGLFRG
jgi:putative transposase